MTGNELRQKYLDFFVSKGHTIIPSAPLVPENDPTTLFTGSGMQPMLPYLLGETHPNGTRLVDSQKCFRAQDIEEVGDNRHDTFFEMLGNWSLGDYFKKEQIEWMFEFLTQELKLDPHKLYVSVFGGNDQVNIPKDEEAVEIWKAQFAKFNITPTVVENSAQKGLQNGRIFYYPEKKNWWSRAGVTSKMPIGEPGGPDSEIFYDFGAERQIHEKSEFKDQACHVNCDCGRFLEIGNNVFMAYKKTSDGFVMLEKKNIDFGGGLERMAAAVNNDPDIFKTDLFWPIIEALQNLSGKKYEMHAKEMQIIADHIRGSMMLAADGVRPGNKSQGYFLRRLIRRAVGAAQNMGIEESFIQKSGTAVQKILGSTYPSVMDQNVISILVEEEEKFKKTLERGLREARKILAENKNMSNIQFASVAFDLFQSQGLPIDILFDEVKNLSLDAKQEIVEQFDQIKQKHQDDSRNTSTGMFKGGLEDHSEITTKYHTATHLLQAALRQVLGNHVSQKGSNITAERLRFDFSHTEKMTPEQIKAVEDLINEKISENIPVTRVEMKKSDAIAQGAMAFFPEKYPDITSVYTISTFSKELCGGPHVSSTGEIGGIKILKEESASSGIRRIYAQLK